MSIVRKVRKLIRSPGEFFRDALIRRYPISLSDRIDNTSSNKYTHTTEDSLRWDKTDERLTIGDAVQVKFPIDFVFTWVDSNGLTFGQQFDEYKNSFCEKKEVIDEARFRSRDELKYALRSIEKYAPWVRRIFIVTNGEVPEWLDENNEKIRIVFHNEIIPETYLPTFNSHAIECSIHLIEDLSEHFVYFNDDMILTRPIKPEYFFSGSGLAYVFVSHVVLPSTPVSQELDSPTEWGAKNARALIYDSTGHYMSRMFAHTFYPQLKSVCVDNDVKWKSEFDACRQNKFRAVSDLLCTGFLHPHIAILTGKAIATKSRLYYFNVRQRTSLNYYRKLLELKGTEMIPFSMCLNDRSSDDGKGFPEYEARLKEFLELFFPAMSCFERTL